MKEALEILQEQFNNYHILVKEDSLTFPNGDISKSLRDLMKERQRISDFSENILPAITIIMEEIDKIKKRSIELDEIIEIRSTNFNTTKN